MSRTELPGRLETYRVNDAKVNSLIWVEVCWACNDTLDLISILPDVLPQEMHLRVK